MSDYNHFKPAEKVPNRFWKNWFVWVTIGAGIITVAIVTIFWGYKYITRTAIEKQTKLEIEFKAITPLPNSTLVKYRSSQNITHALVTSHYKTNANPDAIFKHYDEQLRQHGWQFQGAAPVTDWDRDLGGKVANYCKEDYGVQLQYAGDDANYGWTYAFSVDWELNDCKKTP